MTTLEVVHTTVYRYARPVTFGVHRAMLRPRDSHDLSIVSSGLAVSPTPVIRWMHDVFGNSVTLLAFAEPADELRVESTIRVRHFPLDRPDYPVAPSAELWPVTYDSDELLDLGHTVARHAPDPEGKVAAWARGFVGDGHSRTLDLLIGMTEGIKAQLTYEARDDEGTQTPVDTLERGSGSCRDYALLMMEGVRSLGFAARFVTGYLYDPSLDGGAEGAQGAGATHAWTQVYVPGAGWLEFDPTNGIVGGRNLIRVGVARDPAQVVPLSGTWTGSASDFLGLSVDVQVRRVPTAG